MQVYRFASMVAACTPYQPPSGLHVRTVPLKFACKGKGELPLILLTITLNGGYIEQRLVGNGTTTLMHAPLLTRSPAGSILDRHRHRHQDRHRHQRHIGSIERQYKWWPIAVSNETGSSLMLPRPSCYTMKFVSAAPRLALAFSHTSLLDDTQKVKTERFCFVAFCPRLSHPLTPQAFPRTSTPREGNGRWCLLRGGVILLVFTLSPLS